MSHVSSATAVMRRKPEWQYLSAARTTNCSRTVGQVARGFGKVMALFASQRILGPALIDKAHRLRVVARLHTLYTSAHTIA